MMIAENLACLRARRNNMHRYQRRLAVQHSDIRRSCRRLWDEQAAAEAKSHFRSAYGWQRLSGKSRAMSQLNSFIVRCHQKIIDHYKCLRDSASSDEERAHFQQRMYEEEQSLRQFIETKLSQHPARGLAFG
jgi:hypothetical protein